MSQKTVPILPIINLLTLGIPAIAGAIEKGKAKRMAKREAEAQAAADEAATATANKLANVAMAAGAASTVVDQSGAGHQIMSLITALPPDAVPATAPDWMQYAWVVVTALGVAVKLLMALHQRNS